MKIIISQLQSFIVAQKLWHWILLLTFCSISVYLNYSEGIQQSFNRYTGYQEFLCYVALYGVHALVAYLLYCFINKDFSMWKHRNFIFLLLLSFVIFALRATIYRHNDLVEQLSSEGQKRINIFVFNDVFRLLYLIVPISIIWWFHDRKNQPLYGFSLKNHKAKVYWILLLCMVPLIIGASFLSDFLDYYPRMGVLEVYCPEPWKIWLYELFYGLDFISIELFFRGFMIMAFIKYAGPNAILPMATFYLSIHYGKPLGEAISSFFGGTILGVISFHSRSIYGGIMVHVGIAWLMEIGGYIGNLFRS
ncbi:MAG: CPBP family intramembrane glutamic endopeptidase [Bacteroidota bacterium]